LLAREDRTAQYKMLSRTFYEPVPRPHFCDDKNVSRGRFCLGPKLWRHKEATGSIPVRSTKRNIVGIKKADIKYTTLMKVESGTVNKPSVQTMAKIAKVLGVSIEDLIE